MIWYKLEVGGIQTQRVLVKWNLEMGESQEKPKKKKKSQLGSNLKPLLQFVLVLIQSNTITEDLQVIWNNFPKFQ